MAKTLKSWQGVLAVIGADFGDAGKGKLVDELAERAHIVARFNGGANAGHTVKNNLGNFALHTIPSGIFNPMAVCLVGRGVAVNLEILLKEMEMLSSASVSYKNLVIDENASLTMPWHIMRDGLREKLRKFQIGTTKSGVGPTYADRTERVGLRVKDLNRPSFGEMLNEEIKIQNKFYNLKLNPVEIIKKYQKYAKFIKSYIGETIEIIKNGQKQKKNILFEGAQGFFLDIDFGTYPYVTSSNSGVIGIMRSFAIHPSEIDQVVGISKSYATRVGEGPLPTEQKGKVGDFLIEKGHEYGTTTGRKRRTGWLDLVLVKSAILDNKVTSLALTKLDVLSGLSETKICIGYRKSKRLVEYHSGDGAYLADCEPVYETLPGWSHDISSVRSFNDLPKDAQNYIRRIEEHVQVPVKFISVGPERGQVIYR